MNLDNSNETQRSSAGRAKPPRVLGELRRKVLAWMLLLSFVPMTVATVIGYTYAGQAVVEKTSDHLLSLLSSRRLLVETWVKQHLSEIDVLASSPSVARCCAHFADLSEAEIDAEVTMMLRAIVSRVDAYSDLSVYGANGNLIARVGREDDSSERSTTRALTGAAATTATVTIGEPALAPGGHVTVRIVRPLIHGGDTRMGLILATLDLTRGLDPLLQDRAGMGATGKVFLTTSDGTIFTEPFAGTPPVALRGRPNGVYETHSERPHVGDYVDSYHKVVWGAAEAVAGTNWTVVAEQDQDEATQWLRMLLRRAILTGVLTLAVVIFVTLWISERLGRPLRDLAEVARRIREGHIEARLGPLRGAEAEEVRRAFNEMLDNLREQQRRLAMSAALASVGELSSSIVHEMRNPLSSVKMNLQALRRRVQGDSDFEELADIATAQAHRVETMLDDLLQYGRPVDLRPQPTSFRELTEPALAVVADKAREKNVRIELKDGLREFRLMVDQEQMCRAMTNLLANAIQAVNPGQMVCVSGALTKRDGAQQAQIEVADSGPGLSSEALDRAFKPFFTSKPNGTGLGLANVKKIIELHRGTVAASNRPEGGAVFTICLPLEGTT